MGALAMAHALGAEVSCLTEAVAEFGGVKRRQELVGEAGDVSVMDDFGHHPTAVALTLEGLSTKSDRVVAVFDPRSATSRRAVFQEQYAGAFAHAAHVFIGPPYDQSRIDPADRFSAAQLADDLALKGIPAEHFEEHEALFWALTEQVQRGDLVVFFYSGSFCGLSRRLLSHLEKR